MIRKIFFKIDLLLGSIWTLFVMRLWVADLFTVFCVDEATSFPEWTLPLVAYTVLMRLSLSFMVLRNEKRGLLVALVYMLVGGGCYVLLPKEVMGDALRDMYNYCLVATDYTFSPRWITSEFAPFLFRNTVREWFPVWLLVVPVVCLLLGRRKSVSSDVSAKWLWSGLYLWKDAGRNKYLGGCAFLLVAWCFGVVMNEWLSLVAMAVVPALAYYALNRNLGARAHFYEFLFVMASSCLLWFAQYETGESRDAMLWISALLMLVPVGFVWRAKGLLDGVWAFVFIGILLPSFCLGYDVYTVKEAKRIGNFRDEMCFTGVLKIEDEEGHISLRDRYRLLVPLEHVDVRADRLPLVEVLQEDEWKSFNTWKVGYVKGDLDLLTKRQPVFHGFVLYDVSDKERTLEECVEAAYNGEPDAYMELAECYRNGVGVGQSYIKMWSLVVMGYKLKGDMSDPMNTEFDAFHPFRLAMELLDGKHDKAKADLRMGVLREIAPWDAKALDAMSVMKDVGRWEEGIRMLDEAEREGSEIAVICKVRCFEASEDVDAYERVLKHYVEHFPFFYNKLGRLYVERAENGIDTDVNIKLAVECFEKAGKHVMLDEEGVVLLYGIYREAMEKGEFVYGMNDWTHISSLYTYLGH